VGYHLGASLIANLGVALTDLDPIVGGQAVERGGQQFAGLRAHQISFLDIADGRGSHDTSHQWWAATQLGGTERLGVEPLGSAIERIRRR
jgi:hypothetical protein